jgi:ATP-dependent DNA helicase RecG
MGELTGARQSGGIALRYADFSKDLDLLDAARRAAAELIARDPALERPEHAAYRENVVQRYERGFELFRVG